MNKRAIYQRNYRSKHKEAISKRRKEKRKANPEHYSKIQRKKRLKQAYGISVEEYEALSKAQGHACAICNTHRTVLKKKLVVDHCHATGKIRGLLCTRCNIGIGLFSDSTLLLHNADRYLKKL